MATITMYDKMNYYHVTVGNEVVVNAGTVAQRRRPRRCLSASHVPLGQRNSRGLSSFVDLLNSNINEDGMNLTISPPHEVMNLTRPTMNF